MKACDDCGKHICNRCGEHKDLKTGFYTRKSGLNVGKPRSPCKKCMNKSWNNHYHTNPRRKQYTYSKFLQYRKEDPDRYRNASLRSQRKKREFIQSLKTKCSRCGFDDPRALHFHHLDRSTKIDTISSLAQKNLEEALEEIKKCVLLCCNCHMIVEDERMKKERKVV